jgi:hypothetical protein
MAGNLSIRLRAGAVPVLLGLLYLAEVRHLFPAFRLFAFIFIFLLLADLASMLRGKWRDGLLVAASLALGLCLFEGAAMILEPKRIVNVTGSLWVPKPEVGWGASSAGRFHAERIDPATGGLIYSADYTIDQNLLRRTQSCESGAAIVFFGCSFTFGDGVDDGETMPQIFADLLDRKQRVVNLGYEGYGPQQFLRVMETGLFDAVIGPRPDLFVYLTAPWHAERTSCKAPFVLDAPRYALEKGRIAFKGACAEGAGLWLRRWLEESALYRVAIEPFQHKLSHEDVELYIRIVTAAVQLAGQKYGVSALIPYIRGGEDYLKGTGFDDDAIMRRFRDGGADVVDASLTREQAEGAVIAIKGDNHPTPLANRLRAQLVKDNMGRRTPSALSSDRESRLD